MKKTQRFFPHAIAIACVGLASFYTSAVNAAICEHSVESEWNSGFVAEIKITNNTTTTIDGWDVDWSYDSATIASAWNANVTGTSTLSASNLAWNSTIEPGQSVAFGVQGNKLEVNGPTPTAMVTGSVCSDVVEVDDDNDGVNNDIDQCPDTPEGIEVDETGCAIVVDLDDDNDGVNNDIDQCPNTPEGIEVDETGCAIVVDLDDDNDGVNNDIDQCPNTPEGTEVDETGCAIVVESDDDNDGVNNDIDQCPNTPEGTEVDETGCAVVVEPDDDNDGVSNDIDQCPNTPEGSVVDATGCVVADEYDVDGDGVKDYLDQCPNTPPDTEVDEDGCAVSIDDDNDGVNNDIDECPYTPAGSEVDETGCRDTSELGAGAGYDNPWVGGNYYINPLWAANAAAEEGGEAIAGYNTAVWMDQIGAIEGPEGGMGLRDHLDEAVAQGVDVIMVVVYDLPNRDCAALASSGELLIAEDGFNRYKDEYIAPYAEILSDPAYRDLRIVAIIEVDSLPNLVTNLNVPACVEANGPGGYKDGITHALNEFSKIPNVYSYVDIAHSGWLGWSENFGSAVELIAGVVEDTDAGWASVAGFVSNSSNYTPVEEPYLPDPTLQVGGFPIRSADFYEWNSYFEEKDFVQDWREAMIAQGAPETLGMLIDTARNGWGGEDRPTATSTSTDLNDYVNESRIDRREHRGNWCNQPGGVGFKPWPNPYEGIDAFVWVKPQGESDGISDPDFEVDPDDPAKRHDPMCDPYSFNTSDSTLSTGALDNAPHAGRWFSEGFQILLENAYPALDEPAGTFPEDSGDPTDCEGFNPEEPLVVSGSGVKETVDLRCGTIHVEFAETTSQIAFNNTGSEFDVTIEYDGASESVSGYYQAINASITEMTITPNEGTSSTFEINY